MSKNRTGHTPTREAADDGHRSSFKLADVLFNNSDEIDDENIDFDL